MDFQPHPLIPDSYFALVGKFSFIVSKHSEDDGKWYTSWQDQEKGGSASNTIEGPFDERHQAEANCRRILKALKNKH